jgi:hypothetical protein
MITISTFWMVLTSIGVLGSEVLRQAEGAAGKCQKQTQGECRAHLHGGCGA